MNIKLIDTAAIVQLINRSWSGLSGLVLILFLGIYLDPNEQGYFYTFQSLLSLQVFFEMGLAQVLLQVASHEFARLGGGSASAHLAQGRLDAIMQHGLSWFRNASLSFLLVSIPAGVVYFSIFKSTAAEPVTWLGPWVLACIGQAVVLFLIPILVFREAQGAVAEVAVWRLFTEVLGNLALLVALYWQFELYALALLFLVRMLVSLGFCAWRGAFVRELFKKLFTPSAPNDVWVREVAPFQRRIALSWLSGYLLFSSIPMLIFPILGAKASGQFGMTWTAILGIVSLSMAVVSVRTQRFCTLLAQGSLGLLRQQYSLVAKASFMLAALGIVSLIFGLNIVDDFGLALSDRFLSLGDMCLLGVVAIVNQIIFVQAALIRASKTEPYVMMSVVGGIAQLVLTVVSSQLWGLAGLVALMAAWSLLVSLPWGLCIFNAHKPWGLRLR